MKGRLFNLNDLSETDHLENDELIKINGGSQAQCGCCCWYADCQGSSVATNGHYNGLDGKSSPSDRPPGTSGG